jgi:peroxiredoxin
VKAKAFLINLLIVSLILSVIGCSNGTSTPEIGDKAPDFELKATTGREVKLSDYQNNTVLLVFVSVSCVGCDEQKPYIEEAKTTSSRSFDILYVYRNNGIKVVQDYVNDKRLGNFAVNLPDPKDTVGPRYGFGQALPINVLIDDQGTIREKKVGPFVSTDEIRDWLNSL